MAASCSRSECCVAAIGLKLHCQLASPRAQHSYATTADEQQPNTHTTGQHQYHTASGYGTTYESVRPPPAPPAWLDKEQPQAHTNVRSR